MVGVLRRRCIPGNTVLVHFVSTTQQYTGNTVLSYHCHSIRCIGIDHFHASIDPIVSDNSHSDWIGHQCRLGVLFCSCCHRATGQKLSIGRYCFETVDSSHCCIVYSIQSSVADSFFNDQCRHGCLGMCLVQMYTGSPDNKKSQQHPKHNHVPPMVARGLLLHHGFVAQHCGRHCSSIAAHQIHR